VNQGICRRRLDWPIDIGATKQIELEKSYVLSQPTAALPSAGNDHISVTAQEGQNGVPAKKSGSSSHKDAS